MLDPLTAIGLAGNIVAFVDFSCKLVSKARDIHQSANGLLPENLDAQTIALSLQLLNSKIAGQVLEPDSAQERVLGELCRGCNNVTIELLEALEKWNVRGKRTRWKNARQALKSVTGKEEVDGIVKRLARYREILSLSFLAALSDRIDLAAVASAKSFENLEESTQTIIAAIIENRTAFESSLSIQTASLEEHDRKMDTQHNIVLETIVQTSSNTSREHTRTRDDVVKLSEEAARLRQDMMMELIEIKALIRATAHASGEKQQKQLKEKASLVSASWVAKEIVYSHLVNELREVSYKDPAPHGQEDSKGLQSPRIKRISHPDTPPSQSQTRNICNHEENVTLLECDRCDNTIVDVHYQCSLCDSDDYDLCELCVEGGARCEDEEHWMMKRILNNGKIIVSPTGALAPKKFYASASTTAVLSSGDAKTLDQLDSQEYWNTSDSSKGANNTTTVFDTVTESIKELGFPGHPRGLPTSFLLAIANRFSRMEVKRFKSKKYQPPLFFIGAHMFPTTIWQRFLVTHRAIVTHKNASLGAIAKSMTLGILRDYNRHAVRGRDFPVLVPSPKSASQVKGMAIFGLDEFQRRTIDMSDLFHVGSVDIILNDGTSMEVQACIYVCYNSLEVIPLQEKTWSLSDFIQSHSFKSSEQSSVNEENFLEFGTEDEQTALAERVKELGFRESPSELPNSVVMAISNRFTYDQVLKRSSINSSYYRPFFSSGSSMFPAFIVSRTPGVTLEGVAKQMTPAILRGYNRHAIRDRDWQALWSSSDPKDQVKGTVYFGVKNTPKSLYDVKDATAEIELDNGTKMDLQVNVNVWNGKQEDLVPVAEATWSPSTLLNSPYYKMIATASEAAEDRLAFDQAFCNFQKLDTLGSMQSSSEISR